MTLGKRFGQCGLTRCAGAILVLLSSTVGFGRDPLRQPFNSRSIWNMPIGSEAEYVPARIQQATQRGMTVDEDLIVLTPDAPMLEIYRSDAGWNRNRSRCTIDGGVLFGAPIPTDFIVSPDTWDGLTPNSGLAVLMPDSRTIKQTQPFARCTPEYGTSRYVFGDEDLYGPGCYGAHGGSGLSCIGGTLRVGELIPGAGPIRHVLKVNLYAARNLHYDDATRGYRWPARRADGYAARVYGTQGEPVRECRMGALLALPPSVVIDEMGLETEPARILAQAFQDYGAYVVDDTAWDVYALVTEWSPAGRVTDEFERAWGFEINPRDRDNPWARDMDRIFTNLHVVVNNGPDRIGGGGRPRAPLAEPLDAPTRRIDMRPHWDDRIALENPHKGWYHHFPDNHINKYIIARDEDLTEFPGMDHLYIRLAWAYLEPQEGRFDWDVIDRIIDKWVGHGLSIAFRISCKETSADRIEQQFATPKWVMDAGAEGGFYRNGQEVGPDGPWEPVFDDAVFLEKLEGFLRAFAARYDGKPWLRYIDVGSIGDWGEGHLHSGSRKHYGYEARKKHIDLHVEHFPKTQIVVSDDFVYAISDKQERQRMHRYIVEKGLTYRDDSILVDWFITAHAKTWTVRSPELFADIWRDRPTVLELEHYRSVKRAGNWLGAPDSSLAKFGGGRSGADFFRGALATLRATYIGYHGDARDWYTDNPDLTGELLNRCGYWYFLHCVDVPESLRAGRTHTIRLAWENRGVAPAYHAYALQVRLVGPERVEFEFDAGNQRWMPGPENSIYTQDYALSLPNHLAAGRYDLKIRLHAKEEDRTVFIALDRSLLDEQEYYTVATLEVE